MNRLQLHRTPIAGVHVIESLALGDSRGSLERVFCQDELRAGGWDGPVAQSNITRTLQAGTVRGLHFQHPPHAEIKLVRCLHGEVWDVVVDLRRGSPTFLQWHAQRLSPDNRMALLIPQGCAHGLQTLTDDVHMLYMHSAPHAPASEGGVHPLDARLALPWPLTITQLSTRDSALPALTGDFQGIPLP